MRSTTHILRLTAHIITHRGLHTGDQFADHNTGRLDICAAIYLATGPYDLPDRLNVPDQFFTDEGHALDLIEANPQAMAAIRAVSAAITNYAVPDTNGQPDVIEHVSNWVRTPPIGCTRPPSMSEVIGCILRAAHQATNTPNAA
ncbi:DUF6197 family protein [Streptomyces caniscabiei]|uniref:Uncharacterized protein n=1 Tax=Streptomyces caniscabiei TaxID=2746961 RepID=A0ABU4N272_9ACTN|nr:hypothetical protein [Streptomyces caniscabiei]MBE4790298.1 hypothetical protein [Streptomyces caniscabiei]MBE4799473.1 hypothetical protein [Streptomyces caniscabiei]MDX3015155.1 hypothetical protein [Streptomyces caniscabiei]MDX3042598.1 hypothetical protein [Streptomyces caniscabiei]